MEIRRLRGEEVLALATYADGWMPDPDTSISVVAVKDGKIHGRVFVVGPAHMEGLLVSPEYRGSVLMKRLVDKAEEEARAIGLTQLLAFAKDAEMESYIERLGYQKMELTVWEKKLCP